MKKLLISLAALLSFAVSAASVFVADNGNYALLGDGPCELKEYKDLPGIKGGELQIDGVKYQMCYVVKDGWVHIADQDNDTYSLREEMFGPVK
jgi:hypothetical protein